MSKPISPDQACQRPYRAVWRLAWPMMVANLSIPALGLADTAMLAHLGSSLYLSAVAVGSSLLAFIYWSFGFLRMGTTGASAQSEPDHLAGLLIKAITVGLFIGVLACLLRSPVIDLGLMLMGSPSEISSTARNYLNIRLLSAPAVLMTYALTGWLIGQQQTRAALILAVAVNSCNIALDYLFIVRWQLHSDGAAWASVISEYGGLLLGLLFTRHGLLAALQTGWRASLAAGPPLMDFLKDNGRIFVRTVALLFAFAFFTAQSAALGQTTLAANAILMQWVLASAYGMDGFAHAAEALCGRAFAQRNRPQFLQLVRTCALFSTATAVLASTALALLEPAIIELMTDLPSVREQCRQYYPWLVVLPLLSMASYLFDGIFIGSLRTRALQWSMLLCVFGVYLPLWFVTDNLGNHGLWLSFAAFNTARGISLGWLLHGLVRSAHWQGSPAKPAR